MPAPNRAVTGPAAAARRAIGDRAAAGRLTAAGWLTLPPAVVADGVAMAQLADPAVRARLGDPEVLAGLLDAVTGCVHGRPACGACVADAWLAGLTRAMDTYWGG